MSFPSFGWAFTRRQNLQEPNFNLYMIGGFRMSQDIYSILLAATAKVDRPDI